MNQPQSSNRHRNHSRNQNRRHSRENNISMEDSARKANRRLLPPLPEEIFDFDTADKAGIVFWCQTCKGPVNPEKDKRDHLICPKCKTGQIIWGTQKSVQNYTSHNKKETVSN
ncbi:MAG: hypothetical protein NTZ80_04270 [Patescibacteria group bacterium]|nr:hypothetical protein [Patescibacteria group bacterium]